MSVLLICCTSGRPKAFNRLCSYLDKQTTDDFHFLVVCDDWTGYKFPKSATVVKRDKGEQTNSLCSLNANLLAGLDWIEGHKEYDKIVIVEDDDFYHPQYVSQTKRLLDKAELVGWEEDAVYYVIARKARRAHNVGFSALATTAFKRSVIPYMRQCAERGEPHVDLLLWHGIQERTFVRQPPLVLPDGSTREVPPAPFVNVIARWTGTRQLAHNFTGLLHGQQPKIDKRGNIENEYPRHVGLKQNWHGGTEGASGGHDPTAGGGMDIYGKVLLRWLGEEDAKFYLSFTDAVAPKEYPEGRYPAGVILPLPVDELIG